MVGTGPDISAQASQIDSSFQKAVSAAGIFPKNGPDSSARSWGHHQSGVTFAAQHKLPKLPLPSLESSCQRYLKALKPLQSTQEHEASVAAVHTFLQGEGPILQAQLEEYNRRQENYFEHFCTSIGLVWAGGNGGTPPPCLDSNRTTIGYESFLGDDSRK